jgi:hypothetical protein|tara:strand:- start:10927 stop:11439 length:513 start_codon:yes stop_codon:yes gene_type:complete
MAPTADPYPGDGASALDVLRLAEEYRSAANLLRTDGQRGKPLSYAPFRLVAIHAAELYLTAFLLNQGDPASSLRSLGHDLAARAQLAESHGLKLKKRTAAHLWELKEKREYLVTRYDANAGPLSQVNRLSATLEELATKVRTSLVKPSPRPLQVAAARPKQEAKIKIAAL